MADYVLLSVVKENMGVTETDRDDLIGNAITAASRMVDRSTGRRFDLDGSASARIYYPHDRATVHDFGDLLTVDDIGNITGLVVETGNTTDGWTAVTAYEAHPENALTRSWAIEGLVLPTSHWPRARSARVRVTARWGWPAVPDDVEQATLIQAIRLYKRKDSPEGVVGSSEWGSIRVSRVDPDVAALLFPYRRHGIR